MAKGKKIDVLNRPKTSDEPLTYGVESSNKTPAALGYRAKYDPVGQVRSGKGGLKYVVKQKSNGTQYWCKVTGLRKAPSMKDNLHQQLLETRAELEVCNRALAGATNRSPPKPSKSRTPSRGAKSPNSSKSSGSSAARSAIDSVLGSLLNSVGSTGSSKASKASKASKQGSLANSLERKSTMWNMSEPGSGVRTASLARRLGSNSKTRNSGPLRLRYGV